MHCDNCTYTNTQSPCIATFGLVKTIERNPSPFMAGDAQWRDHMTELDVVRSLKQRLHLKPTRTSNDTVRISIATVRDSPVGERDAYIDTRMANHYWPKSFFAGWKNFYSLEYDLSNAGGIAIPKVRTSDSAQYLAALYNRYFEAHPNEKASRADRRFRVRRPSVANHIAFAPWYMDQQNRANWPVLDLAFVQIASDDDYVERFLAEKPGGTRTPVDALGTLGSTMLHEVRNP